MGWPKADNTRGRGRSQRSNGRSGPRGVSQRVFGGLAERDEEKSDAMDRAGLLVTSGESQTEGVRRNRVAMEGSVANLLVIAV
jgi:hypothetical protein